MYLSNLVSEITIPSVFVSHRFFDRMNFSAIRINAAGLFLWSSERPLHESVKGVFLDLILVPCLWNVQNDRIESLNLVCMIP